MIVLSAVASQVAADFVMSMNYRDLMRRKLLAEMFEKMSPEEIQKLPGLRNLFCFIKPASNPFMQNSL